MCFLLYLCGVFLLVCAFVVTVCEFFFPQKLAAACVSCSDLKLSVLFMSGYCELVCPVGLALVYFAVN